MSESSLFILKVFTTGFTIIPDCFIAGKLQLKELSVLLIATPGIFCIKSKEFPLYVLNCQL